MISPGDILCSSWGYDQTNFDFYRVTERKGARVYLQALETLETPGPHDNPQSMTALATPGEPTETLTFYCNAKPGYQGEEYCKIKPYAFARAWDGQPKRCSWYA